MTCSSLTHTQLISSCLLGILKVLFERDDMSLQNFVGSLQLSWLFVLMALSALFHLGGGYEVGRSVFFCLHV